MQIRASHVLPAKRTTATCATISTSGTRFFRERAPWHADDRAKAWQERSRRSGEAPSDRVQKWRRCSIAAYPHSDWGGYSGSAWARSRPLSRGDTREGSGCNTMTGSWPGQCISSVITRPGARRADTTQHAETEVRRLCAGLRPDRETIFDAYSQDGSPSQPQERERAHDLRAGGAPCRVSPGQLARDSARRRRPRNVDPRLVHLQAEWADISLAILKRRALDHQRAPSAPPARTRESDRPRLMAA